MSRKEESAVAPAGGVQGPDAQDRSQPAETRGNMRTADALFAARGRLGRQRGPKGPMKAPSVIGREAFDERKKRESEAEEFQALAEDAMRHSRMDVAAELLMRAQQRDPTNVRVLALRAHALLALGEDTLAQDVGLDTIWAFPDHLEGHLALARSFLAQGLLEDAAAVLSVAQGRAELQRLRDPARGLEEVRQTSEAARAGIHARCVLDSGITHVPGKMAYSAGRTCLCAECAAARVQNSHRVRLTASGEIRAPSPSELQVVSAAAALDPRAFTRAVHLPLIHPSFATNVGLCIPHILAATWVPPWEERRRRDLLAMVELAIDAGCPIDFRAPARDVTPLAVAVAGGNLPVVRLLLSKGADPTLVRWALWPGPVPALSALLQHLEGTLQGEQLQWALESRAAEMEVVRADMREAVVRWVTRRADREALLVPGRAERPARLCETAHAPGAPALHTSSPERTRAVSPVSRPNTVPRPASALTQGGERGGSPGAGAADGVPHLSHGAMWWEDPDVAKFWPCSKRALGQSRQAKIWLWHAVHCNLCGTGAKKGVELWRCERCRGVRYCCKTHQREDWPQHRARCRVLTGVRRALAVLDRLPEEPFAYTEARAALLADVELSVEMGAVDRLVACVEHVSRTWLDVESRAGDLAWQPGSTVYGGPSTSLTSGGGEEEAAATAREAVRVRLRRQALSQSLLGALRCLYSLTLPPGNPDQAEALSAVQLTPLRSVRRLLASAKQKDGPEGVGEDAEANGGSRRQLDDNVKDSTDPSKPETRAETPPALLALQRLLSCNGVERILTACIAGKHWCIEGTSMALTLLAGHLLPQELAVGGATGLDQQVDAFLLAPTSHNRAARAAVIAHLGSVLQPLARIVRGETTWKAPKRGAQEVQVYLAPEQPKEVAEVVGLSLRMLAVLAYENERAAAKINVVIDLAFLVETFLVCTKHARDKLPVAGLEARQGPDMYSSFKVTYMLIDPVVELLLALLSHPRLRTAHDMQIALRSLQRFAAGLLWDKVDESYGVARFGRAARLALVERLTRDPSFWDEMNVVVRGVPMQDLGSYFLNGAAFDGMFRGHLQQGARGNLVEMCKACVWAIARDAAVLHSWSGPHMHHENAARVFRRAVANCHPDILPAIAVATYPLSRDLARPARSLTRQPVDAGTRKRMEQSWQVLSPLVTQENRDQWRYFIEELDDASLPVQSGVTMLPVHGPKWPEGPVLPPSMRKSERSAAGGKGAAEKRGGIAQGTGKAGKGKDKGTKEKAKPPRGVRFQE